ncbi:MAG TPA: aspartate/glutamate racemase family protein [Candidatus Paceibacterota bacterium]|nr:aspartate/glutamate racemase family protein [Candidatus Paceibacterota bacterium]
MIGVFDSGVGGLTVLRAMRDVFPSIDVVYFGDTKNAPYGERSREELSALTVAGLQFLLGHGATNIVSACNSVSASLAVSLFDAFSLAPGQLIEMVGPTVAAFRGSKEKVALCATNATINSGIYQDAFRMIGVDIQGLPIPQLAGAIEAGEPESTLDAIVADAFKNIGRNFDTIVLGCTHYPLALSSFKKVLGDIELFDPAHMVAARVERDLWPREVGNGTTKFFISKDSDVFRRLIPQLFPESTYSLEVLE